MPLVKTKGLKEGHCNICGVFGPLTDDHTPPKGSIRVSHVDMRHIVEILGAEDKLGKGRFSQNGVKYRTLCVTCNGRLLGIEYDPAFIDFTQRFGALLKSRIALPPVVYVPGKPQRIMRSVLGHIQAQGVDRHNIGTTFQYVSTYFLDPNAPLPAPINIYYWAYPFQKQVLVRDCGFMDTRKGGSVVIWLMKFFPVAFMVTWNRPPAYTFDHLPSFESYRSTTLDEVVDIPVPLRPLRHERWPELPVEPHSLLLYGEEAIWAVGRPG